MIKAGDDSGDLPIYIQSTGGTTFLGVDGTGNVILPIVGKGASGKDFVCITSTGLLVRSNTACA